MKLMWIPGYKSFEGNEEADMLAKIGAAYTNVNDMIIPSIFLLR